MRHRKLEIHARQLLLVMFTLASAIPLAAQDKSVRPGINKLFEWRDSPVFIRQR